MINKNGPKIKVYVPVLVRYDTDGKAIPLKFEFENGKVYVITKIIDSRHASASVGGYGMRYDVIVNNSHEMYLFEQGGRWFVEAYGNEMKR